MWNALTLAERAWKYAAARITVSVAVKPGSTVAAVWLLMIAFNLRKLLDCRGNFDLLSSVRVVLEKVNLESLSREV